MYETPFWTSINKTLTSRSDETMMTIHFNADLRPTIKEQVGMLHWVMDPLVSGFIIAYDLTGNQVLICNFDVGLLLYPFLNLGTNPIF